MIYLFDDCQLDTDLYTLHRDGQLVSLPPREFKVLFTLIQHRHRVVRREELIEQVWPDLFISQTTLDSAIRAARRAVGDSGRTQRIIKTIHRIGYRFVAPIEEHTNSTELYPPEHHHPPRATPRPARIRSPFVGRQQELACLHEQLEHVRRGQGRVVKLVGAPGIGKSRLLQEFYQSLRAEQVTYLQGHCVAYGYLSPYLPIRDIVRQSCAITPGDHTDTIVAKVHEHLGKLGLDPREKAPYILRLLGVKVGIERLAALSPDLLHVHLLTSLHQMLIACSRQRPLVLVIEDLHWVDRTTEGWIGSLIEGLEAVSMLLLTTCRPEYATPWMETSYTFAISVPPLSDEDGLRLVRTSLTQHVVPPHLEPTLLRQASGNPLFLEVLTGFVAEQETTVAHRVMPASIQDVLHACMAQLPEEPRQLLQTAAVCAHPFSKRCLQTLCTGGGDVTPHLAELERRAFCMPQGQAEEPCYAFTHALIQEAAYQSLPPGRRQILHTTIAQALETVCHDQQESNAALLAYHYAHTEQSHRAVAWLIHLAESATSICAYEETLAALQEALNHVARLPLMEQTRYRLDLVLRQAHTLFAMRNAQDAMTLLRQYQQQYEQLQDATLGCRYALLLSQVHSHLGTWETAAEQAHRAIDLAGQCRDDVTMGQAYYVLGMERYWAGYAQEGVAYTQRAISLLAHAPEHAQQGMAHVVLGLNTLVLGEFERALQAADQAYTIGTALGDIHLQTLACWTMGWIQAVCGQWDAGIRACQRSLQYAPDPLSVAMAKGWLGCAYLEKGDYSQAIAQLEQAIPCMHQFHYRRLEALYTALLGEAYCLCGDLRTARNLAQQGLSMAHEASYHLGIGLAQRALGRISYAAGALRAAEQHLHAALETFQALHARFEVARTWLDLALLAHRQGDDQCAVRQVTEAYHMFCVLRVPTYMERAKQCGHDIGLASDLALSF